MKINDAAAAVGVSTKNIRYYESEGLLSPRRNRENNYRDYGEADIERLRQIKLLRKLAMPIEEIRALFDGAQTLPEAMARNTELLESARRDIEQSQLFCGELRESALSLEQMDTKIWLAKMSSLEQEGHRFMNSYKKQDIKRIAAPVTSAAVMIALMAALAGLMIWGFATDPQGAPPLVLAVILVSIPLVVIIGIVIALTQRLKELKGGEMDAAGKY